MFKSKLAVLIGSIIMSSTLFGGEKVVIGAYGDYPTASCQIAGKYYLIPNNTPGEVTKWGAMYTDGKDKELYAKLDMFTQSEVKLLAGPQKGKVCAINHVYIQLK